MYRAELHHPHIGQTLVTKPSYDWDDAAEALAQALAHGFSRGKVQEYYSGIGWRECPEPPERKLDPDWDREQKFEHARQTGAI